MSFEVAVVVGPSRGGLPTYAADVRLFAGVNLYNVVMKNTVSYMYKLSYVCIHFEIYSLINFAIANPEIFA